MSLEQTIGNLEIRYANVVTFVGTSNTMVDTTTGRIQTKGFQHNSNVITDISGPHGRVAPTLKKYPEIIFEEGKFDRNDTTNTYVQAGYTVSTDSVYNDRQVYRSFDGIDDPAVGFTYSSEDVGGNGFVQASGLPVSGVTFQDENDTSYTGHYIKLELPKKIKLNSVYLSSRNQENNLAAPNDKRPTSGTFLGSNDGTNWTLLRTFNDGELTWSSSTFATNASFHTTNITNIVNDGYFSYIMFLIEKIKTTNAYGVAEITELEYYGYEEYTPAGDHSVDTTFMSRFNNPQLTGVKVLVDGGMANPGTNQISGGADPSGNNSTYDATNKYYTLNGTLTSNLSVEANTFLEGDQPHAVSMWFNSSNLEANVSNTCVFSIASEEKLDSLNLDLQSNTWHNLTYAYQGEGGSRVTYLDGRKVVEDQAEDTFGEYPPFAMTGYSQGGYVVSASGEYPGTSYLAHEAFNGTVVDNGDCWLSTDATYDANTGDYNGSANLGSDSGGPAFANADKGEWLKLEMPHKLVLDYITICGSTGTTVNPKNWKIYGSNDDKNWDVLLSKTNSVTAAFNATSGKEHAVGATKAYKYFALVVIKSGGLTSGTHYIQVGELEFYGHRENDLVRLPDPTNVLKYPHVAFPNSDGTAVGNNAAPSVRGYVATTDDASPSYPVGKVFDERYQTGAGDAAQRWQPGASYYASNGGLATSVLLTLTTLGDGTTYRGNYIQLESPHKLIITKYQIYSGAAVSTHRVTIAVLLGSNTGNTNDWVDLGSGDTTLPAYSGSDPNYSTTATISNTGAYKYHRLVIRAIHSATTPVVFQVKYYGTGVDSIPIQIGGGNIDKVANFRVYDKFIQQDQALEIWDAQKDYFGRAKSQMVLQQGKLGVGTDAPQGRFSVADEPHNLEEFPPRAIPSVGPINVGNSKVYIDGHGTYEVLYSVTDPSHYNNATDNPLNLFDKKVNNLYSQINTFRLNSAGATDGAVGSGNPLADPAIYTGSNTHGDQTYKSLGGYGGIWYGLKFPYKVNLNQAQLLPSGVTVSPNTAVFLGSEDGGLTWTKIGGFGGASWVAYKYNKYTLSHTKPINAVAIVITHSNHYYAANLGEMKFFGTREQGQSVLHDGQLTLTKSLNVPRIGPPLDADDTPRRDRLVVEYNTSTNPTFEGAVRDTSGRGNNGVMRNGATYDATKKSLEFPLNPATSSGSGNRDSIETGPILDGTQLVKGYSVSTWFRADSQAAWEQIWVLGKVGLGKHEGLWLSGGSTISIHNDVGGGLNYYYPCTSGGGWKHVTFVRKGTTASDHDVYVDGVKVSSSTTTGGANVQSFEKESNLILGENINHTHYGFDGAISQFKLYDTALTAEEVKTLYDMGRCDEGHHVVNFSKTRVGIGLGDGEAPRGALDVRGETPFIGPGLVIHQAASGNWGTEGDPANMNGLILTREGETGLTTGSSYWNIATQALGNGSLLFSHRGKNSAYIQSSNSNNPLDFTGQHRTFIKDVPFSQAGDLEGLIVSSDQNKYIKISGGIETGSNAIMINESLPVVSLSNIVTDKKCFGVISASEDPEQRSDAYGSFVTPFDKEKGDTRVYINSVGEGAIWVSNIGGSLEAGDYITTSNVAGYGQKQDSDSLKNYTVAKITMDCDFEPVTQPIQQILRSNVIQTYYLGDVHHMKNVPHEFVTTTVGVDDTWSNVSIDPSNVAYAEWSNLEANTQNTYTLTYTQTSNVVYDTKYTLTTTANVTESDAWDRVSIDPPSVTYAQYSNLEANTQSSYSLTFTKTTTDTKTPGAWSALESNTQSLYNEDYYQSVEEEVASDYTGATTHTRVTDVIENELDVHGQIQWEDHSTETEKAYKIRYLDVSGTQTDSANAVHIAAFVGCTYHCG